MSTIVIFFSVTFLGLTAAGIIQFQQLRRRRKREREAVERIIKRAKWIIENDSKTLK